MSKDVNTLIIHTEKRKQKMTSVIRSSSMVLALVSWFSIFQQNCKQSFMIPSNILDTEPISKKDCDIKADKYLQNTNLI